MFLQDNAFCTKSSPNWNSFAREAVKPHKRSPLVLTFLSVVHRYFLFLSSMCVSFFSCVSSRFLRCHTTAKLNSFVVFGSSIVGHAFLFHLDWCNKWPCHASHEKEGIGFLCGVHHDTHEHRLRQGLHRHAGLSNHLSCLNRFDFVPIETICIGPFSFEHGTGLGFGMGSVKPETRGLVEWFAFVADSAPCESSQGSQECSFFGINRNHVCY